MRKEIPKKFEVPKLKTFDGTQDPADHILHFQQVMALHKENDALLCRIFPTSLAGTTLFWFHHLPAGEIDSYGEMAKQFIAHYLSNKKEAKGVDCLFQFRNKDGESVNDYLERFRKESSQLEKCNKAVLIASLKNGLPKEHDLFRSLVNGQQKTIHDMLQWVRKYILLEEVVGAQSVERKIERKEKSHGADNKIFKRARFERKVVLALVSNQEFRLRSAQIPEGKGATPGHEQILCVA